jgi:putative transcriptional regulator
MNPRHHLNPGLLLAYAGGAASDAEGLMAATHLTFCASCRADLTAQERCAGAFLEEAADAPVPDALLAATLAKLDDAVPVPSGSPAGKPATGEKVGTGDVTGWKFGRDRLSIPQVLRERLQRGGVSGLSFLAPGIKSLDLPTSSPGVRLRLMRLAPGLTVPAHGHAGNEYTLVLTGAFQDDTSRRYAAGDLCVREAGESHLQHVEGAGPCFALQLNQGPLVPLTWKGRLLSVLFDRPWSP